MKASFFASFGGPEVLQYGELPDPVPAAGEVVVDIHAASVNAADWKMRAGQYSRGIPLPHVPGRDFSGVVAALGEGAKDFEVGDAVFGVCEVPREGAYAEKIAIRQEILARKPASLTHAQCASIGLAGLTALVSIERSEEHTSELQSQFHLVCRLLLEKKNCSQEQNKNLFHLTRHQKTDHSSKQKTQ